MAGKAAQRANGKAAQTSADVTELAKPRLRAVEPFAARSAELPGRRGDKRPLLRTSLMSGKCRRRLDSNRNSLSQWMPGNHFSYITDAPRPVGGLMRHYCLIRARECQHDALVRR